MFGPKQVLDINIISIVIAILLVIILKIWINFIVRLSEEILDRDYRNKYEKTKENFIKSIIVTTMSLFIIIIILTYYQI